MSTHLRALFLSRVGPRGFDPTGRVFDAVGAGNVRSISSKDHCLRSSMDGLVCAALCSVASFGGANALSLNTSGCPEDTTFCLPRAVV